MPAERAAESAELQIFLHSIRARSIRFSALEVAIRIACNSKINGTPQATLGDKPPEIRNDEMFDENAGVRGGSYRERAEKQTTLSYPHQKILRRCLRDAACTRRMEPGDYESKDLCCRRKITGNGCRGIDALAVSEVDISSLKK